MGEYVLTVEGLASDDHWSPVFIHSLGTVQAATVRASVYSYPGNLHPDLEEPSSLGV